MTYGRYATHPPCLRGIAATGHRGDTHLQVSSLALLYDFPCARAQRLGHTDTLSLERARSVLSHLMRGLCWRQDAR